MRVWLALFILCTGCAVFVDAKPPKNLSRMRQKGSYGSQSIQINSLANQGQRITVIEEGENVAGDDLASDPEEVEIEEEEEEKEETDELTELLNSNLSSEEETSTYAHSALSTVTMISPETSTVPVTEHANMGDVLAKQKSDMDVLEELLSSGYDWRVRPPGQNTTVIGGGPVLVRVNMLLRSISKIDNVNMEFSSQLTFRESWKDSRLAYANLNGNLPDFLILPPGQQIWMPDSFFQNEKHASKHMIDKPNVLIRIYRDGTVLYSVRISLTLSCPMHLHMYPMDVQNCLIDLASYAYTTDDIEYMWKDIDPVQLKTGLGSSLPSFQLENVTTTYCTSRTNTGTYSCLRVILELKRQFSYYLLQLYIPSTMLVIVSWVSFWLDRTAVPARVTLGVTTLLTMTTQSSGINSKLPPVAYIKAIDVWIGACLTFIFGALLEFAWVTYLAGRLDGQRAKTERQMKALLPATNSDIWLPKSVAHREEQARLKAAELQSQYAKNRKNEPSKYWLIRWWQNVSEFNDKPKRVDLLSRIGFPMTFIIFNLYYWLHYTQQSFT